jgi:NAD(P)-dependent dehydrogenase (short-subunit alcohol dehydrogenase family)
MSRFTGKVAIVTGAAGGIGQSIAEHFLAEGAKVGVVDISAAKWVETSPYSASALALQIDISREAEVEAAVAKIVATFGRLDVLVNNAAVFVYGDVTRVSESDWDRVIGVNIKGPAFLCKHSIPHMRAKAHSNTGTAADSVQSSNSSGAIVNISSISGFCGQTEFAPYSLTKAAILQLTRNIAVDEGPHGIRCNTVCPGPILTAATETHAKGLGKTVDDVVSELTGHLILKRMGRPSEVAKAVLFLASEDASFTTGTHLMVDGGYLLC